MITRCSGVVGVLTNLLGGTAATLTAARSQTPLLTNGA
jgi:hypothetical protein